MKIQSVLIFFSLLLFTSLIQVGEGTWVVLPPGKRQLKRKVHNVARSFCEEIRRLDCEGMKLNDLPMKALET